MQELCTYAVDSSSQVLGPLHFPWDVDEHGQGKNEPDNLIEDQKNLYICLMMKMKLLPNEDEPKQKLNRRSRQRCNVFCCVSELFCVGFFFFKFFPFCSCTFSSVCFTSLRTQH